MATITTDEVVFFGQVRTTNATATDVTGNGSLGTGILAWASLDKENETYVIECKAVQENAANPLAWYQLRITTVSFVTGAPVFLDGSAGANGIVIQHGDAAWACTMVISPSPNAKVQVTGAIGTNLNWFVKVTRQLLASNP